MSWHAPLGTEIAVEIMGDSELVIHWLNGVAYPKRLDYSVRVESIANKFSQLWQRGSLVMRTAEAEWARHVYRELNTRADGLANQAMDSNASDVWCLRAPFSRPSAMRGWFDGGRRDELHSSCGWCLQAAWTTGLEDDDWREIATGSVTLPPGTTVVDAELHGLEQVALAMFSVATYGRISFQQDRVCFM